MRRILILWCIFCVARVFPQESGNKEALLVIDVQDCFLSFIKEATKIIPIINQLREKFPLVVFTKEWHPEHHVSFASQHEGSQVFDVTTLHYDKEGKLCKNQSRILHPTIPQKDCQDQIEYSVEQPLYPDHCIMGQPDAELNEDLLVKNGDLFINKGSNPEFDAHSAFFNAGGFDKTELHSLFEKHHVGKVYIVGVALEYCVFWSATDALNLGYETFVVEDATFGVTQEAIDQAMHNMKQSGIQIIQSKDLLHRHKNEL